MVSRLLTSSLTLTSQPASSSICTISFFPWDATWIAQQLCWKRKPHFFYTNSSWKYKQKRWFVIQDRSGIKCFFLCSSKIKPIDSDKKKGAKNKNRQFWQIQESISKVWYPGSGTKPKLVAKILATNNGNRFSMGWPMNQFRLHSRIKMVPRNLNMNQQD